MAKRVGTFRPAIACFARLDRSDCTADVPRISRRRATSTAWEGVGSKGAHAIITGPGGWQKDVKKWRQFGNDHGYHYYGSPWTFAQIGTGFGEAMVELLK